MGSVSVRENQLLLKKSIKRFLNALRLSVTFISFGNEFQRHMADLVKDRGGKGHRAKEKFWPDCRRP